MKTGLIGHTQTQQNVTTGIVWLPQGCKQEKQNQQQLIVLAINTMQVGPQGEALEGNLKWSVYN